MKAAKQHMDHYLTGQGKIVLYTSIIRPIMCHCCTKTSTSNLEKHQERAPGFICTDYDIPLPSLLPPSITVTTYVNCLKEAALNVLKFANKIAHAYNEYLINLK